MMNTQSQRILSLAPGEARRVGTGAGEITVLRGRVWLTGRCGPADDNDLVLSPGDTLRLADAQGAVIESWRRGEGAELRWQPRAQRAGLAGFAGAFFAALARTAASSASRAQGCISAGDSMASSGAVK
ncbi:DUF2917 domain-containing protein [Piscinibacter aquaticus]|uniref:DUF2917 domain-containing protein n=1 Tax=Piscinibacter aquaticus TaxID=392597 RepID=A0A5C6U179_9BURK|nr:DUF2917 domain-containing protein [Piscinibacter aquaticus]